LQLCVFLYFQKIKAIYPESHRNSGTAKMTRNTLEHLGPKELHPASLRYSSSSLHSCQPMSAIEPIRHSAWLDMLYGSKIVAQRLFVLLEPMVGDSFRRHQWRIGTIWALQGPQNYSAGIVMSRLPACIVPRQTTLFIEPVSPTPFANLLKQEPHQSFKGIL
jgi:hypothetical protein